MIEWMFILGELESSSKELGILNLMLPDIIVINHSDNIRNVFNTLITYERLIILCEWLTLFINTTACSAEIIVIKVEPCIHWIFLILIIKDICIDPCEHCSRYTFLHKTSILLITIKFTLILIIHFNSCMMMINMKYLYAVVMTCANEIKY